MAERTMEELLRAPRAWECAYDVIKLMMFPYSLEGAAKTWYEKEPPNSILTWEDLVTKFVNQFFPPSKTTHLKNEISRFTQKFEETFSEAWERFKELLRACPHHGFTELTQVDTFYNGLNDNEQDSLNAAAGGNLLSKTTREALNIIENKSKVRYSRNKPNASRINATSSKTDERIDKLADQLSTLELADRSITYPKGLAEDVFVKVGKFHFPTDFVVVDLKAESGCTLSYLESFFEGPDQTTRYSSTNDKSINQIDIIDAVCEEYAPEFLGFPNSSGGNPTPTSEPFTSEFILEEIEAYLKDDSISPEIDHADFNPEEDICLIEQLLNNDPFQLPPMDLKQSEVTEAKSSIKKPPELELKDLLSHLEYAFLEENKKLPIIIAKEDDYKPTVQSQRRVNPKIQKHVNESIKMVNDTCKDSFKKFTDEPALVCLPPPEDANDKKEKQEVKNLAEPTAKRQTLSSVFAITSTLPSIEPKDSLIMGDEHLSTFSAEENIPIPRESEDTSRSDSKNRTSSARILMIQLDESTFLVTPLSDSNKDECLTPGDDIEFLLHHDLSTPLKSVSSIFEGFINDPPFEENDDLFDWECKTNDWKRILYDAQIDKAKCFNPGGDNDEIDAFLAIEVPTYIEGYYDSEGDILYLESLLSDDTTHNLSPDSPENSHTIIESLPTSTTLIEDSDSNREEIDIFSGPYDSIPQGIESDFDSEEDIIDNLLNDDPIPEYER
ncbi:reverse transcriptase domain-containing protein [Tanacetum coccineum]